MSAATAQAPLKTTKNTRRVPRFPLSVPADVTVLRSGIPFSIPGRSVSIGERGVGVVLAGELHPGDSVGIEFRLPDAGGPFRLKAVVRYQALLHCGLEFVNLTSEQQTLIEHWTRKKSATIPPPVITTSVPLIEAQVEKHHGAFRRALWIALAGTLLLVGALGWWHWHHAWSELESQIPASKSLIQPAPTTVPTEVMEGLVTHKTDPIYPEAARQANIQGIVALDVIIGPDGTVVDVQPISGPEQLAPAAVDAVKWWRFQPYLLNGQAVQVRTTLAVDFRAN
jgi:TonB family protein